MSTLVMLLQRPWSAEAPVVSASTEQLASALTAASRAAVEPLVARRLLALTDLDQPTRARAFQAHAAARLRQRAAWAHLSTIQRTLEAAGVDARSFKGPVFAELAYEDPTSRVSNDLDFFLDERDLDAATRALATLGYGPSAPATTGDLALGGGVELRVHGSASDPPVDLHVQLLKPLQALRSPVPDGERVLVRGIPTFDRPWTIALAVVQLVQDRLALRRIVDLAALLGRSTPDDLARAAELTSRFGHAGVLRLGAELARQLGTPVPAGALDRPWTRYQRDLARRDLDAFVEAGAAPRTTRERLEALVESWRLLDRRREAARLAARLAFPPADYVRARGGHLRRWASIARRLVN